MKTKNILFLSNGHGEDTHNCQIIKALTKISPDINISAMPIVGSGNSYKSLNIPIINPTANMPSGGFLYLNPLLLLQDLKKGLISLTWQQLQAVWKFTKNCDLIMATGDIVVAAIAYSTKVPYIVFLSADSSYYEGRINLGLILPKLLNNSRCLKVFARDTFTAKDLNQQGIKKAEFVGTPVMDNLTSTGKNLLLKPKLFTIAILPGSRLPEAGKNLCLLLKLVREIVKVMGENVCQFRATIVPILMSELEAISTSEGWEYQGNKLIFSTKEFSIEVICYEDAFADILQYSNLVIGMAGTAIEQAVGLGKPVITIPGNGPSFTYRFAEAQTRLLGSSVQVIGKQPANSLILQEAAQKVKEVLADQEYLEACIQNGLERMGKPGGSEKIANYIVQYLSKQ
ncbi:lipid-A-disaccharide synthase-related protein [Okeania sp.]|uniref:lipid-A-disaccharide synthase-related protein n=1 Tax=Okeania sp. TaxID=3100323 RepID=UPI002B4B2BFE|nr:lipid-A-disaccharide synthase-related protein [Okeania sp.]MEB3343129.1 lipid-A-disaccharide synthase-related protein [Okeania sp.]